MFPIYDVSASPPDRFETLGSKEKVWLVPEPHLGLPVKPHLFKVGRPNTGENWAEKVCCEILKMLHIPNAEYNFATRNGVRGVLSESFLPENARFLPANMILSRTDPGYEDTLRFHQTRYTLAAALEVLGNLPLQAPLGFADIYRGMTACEIFVGYLLCDTLVGNTDRHHENWGVVEIVEFAARTIAGGTFSFHLAPSFDHASSLGRDLTDRNRRERLNTSDRRASVEAYAERGRSAFFGADPIGRTLTGREMAESLVQVAPRPARMWAEKLVDLDRSSLESILEQVPREIMSEDAVQFAIRLFAYNQRMIQEVALAR